MTKFKLITDTNDLNGKKVLVRVDWNIPLMGGEIIDDFRIKKSLPTINFLKERRASVIVATHFEPKETDLIVLKKYLPEGVTLLENLRLHPEEEENEANFAKSLAVIADVYVNEAFSVSHRKHASIVGVPKLLPSYAGLHFAKEVEMLSKAFNPSKPFMLILGGAKFETKLPLVEKFLPITDSIFIGGAMAGSASELPIAKDPKIIFPTGDIKALDANEETISMLKAKIDSSKFILWNGPLGNYEHGYKEGTHTLAKILADSGKEVIVGGGDTLAVMKELNLEGKFSFVSTGGGAMLDFLATGTLPGIEALK